MIHFQKNDPHLSSQWRAIILFGRNTATYKFALAKSLIKMAEQQKNAVDLETLAEIFAQYLVEHVSSGKKQINANKSKYLHTCQDFSEGKCTQDDLIKATLKEGFRYVLDAFHLVSGEFIPTKFYQVDSKNKKLLFHDNLSKLSEEFQFQNLFNEIEARWLLVETAWDLNINTHLLEIHYDIDKSLFFTQSRDMKRVDVTSSREALNGYQKGQCFYCFADISVLSGSPQLGEVDHFLPHKNKRIHASEHGDINGIWNLVLACQLCNQSKRDKIPALKYLERLSDRNEFLIESHHPLRETLMRQSGDSAQDRRKFLEKQDQLAISASIHRWSTREVQASTF
jgi:5-methylcytosine-specific restriction endonuclease McrA